MALDPQFNKTTLLLHGETVDPDGVSLVAGYSGKSLTPELGTAYVQNVPVAGTFGGYPALKLVTNAALWVYGSQLGVFNGDFTVEFWFYQTSYQAYDVYFASCAGTTNTYSGCAVYYAASGGYYNLAPRGAGGNITAARPSLNTWHHMAIVSLNGFVSLYLDGVRVGTVTAANGTSQNACNGGRIGYTASLSSTGFVGYASDLRIYKGVAKAAGGTYPVPPRPGRPYGTQLDSSPKGRGVAGVGSAASLYTGMSKFGGGCLRFDGASYLSIASSTDFDFGTGLFTIEYWMYLNQAQNCRAVMFGVNGNAAGLQMWIQADGNFWFAEPTSNNPISGLLGTPGDIPVGEWFHVAMVWEATTTYAVYINGVQKARTTAGKAWPTGARAVYLGCDPASSGTTGFLNGYIDDFRITKGVARYTENFTPPTEAFPDGQAVVSGVVRDVDGNLCSRKVFVHSRDTGRLLGTAVSDPVTGVYEIAADETCYVVCLDSTSSYNAKIVDGVDPTA